MATDYVITPAKGRVGNRRQIAAFQVQTDCRPHDLGKLRTALENALAKISGYRDVVVRIFDETSNPGEFRAEAFRIKGSDKPIADLHIDTIEG